MERSSLIQEKGNGGHFGQFGALKGLLFGGAPFFYETVREGEKWGDGT